MPLVQIQAIRKTEIVDVPFSTQRALNRWRDGLTQEARALWEKLAVSHSHVSHLVERKKVVVP